MKKLILLGIIAAVALAGIYYFFPQQQTADNQPKKFSSVEELNAFINASSQQMYGGATAGEAMRTTTEQQSAQKESIPSAGSSGYSRTNIQVEGVDEADIVKTDGKYIYAVSGSKVIILDAYPAENAKIVSQIDFNGSVSEIFINGDRLVVFGQESRQYPIMADAATGVSDASGAIAEKMIASESIMRPYYSPLTSVEVYDVSDKNSPKLARNISVDGGYYDSRMIGDYVYVIAQQPVYNYGGGPVSLPVVRSESAVREIPATDIYYFGMPDSSFVFTNMLSLNTQTSDEPSSKTFLMGYSQNMYVSPDSIYIVYQKRTNEIDIYGRIVNEIIIPTVPSEVQNKIREIQNYNISAYSKMQEIGKLFETYISSLNPEQAAAVMKAAEEKVAALYAQIAKEMEKTVIHKIAIDGGNIEYKTNGEVPGYTLNQFSMDEHNGYFRVATTTSGNSWGGLATGTVARSVQTSVTEQTAAGSAEKTEASSQASGAETPSGVITEEEQKRIASQPIVAPSEPPSGPRNHLYVLDGDLRIVGKVEDLAAGERIYSVRFMGDKAYMVTFRQTDPLFVIDLSDTSSPKVLGYLKVPGVSDYLHPYDETHIIGVGRDASDEGRIKGLKLALFDVSDFANPKEVSKHIIGDRGTSSEALNDHKAFLFDKEKNLLVIPVSEYSYAEPVTAEGKWEQPKYWQGAYVFNIDLNGFALKGKITHANDTVIQENEYYYDWSSQIRRFLFIENTLYTISNKMVKMNSLSDLNEINKVELPAQSQRYYGGIGMME